MKIHALIFIGLLIDLFAFTPAYSCTNIMVTKGASADGSVMITYAADSHTRYGALAFYPAADHAEGAMLDIFHYESGMLMGQIPEAAHTFSVVGFMNEHQVAIGETTFGGLSELGSQPGAVLDYGSLMKIGLQRGKTAREVIRVMVELADQYGYASSGESFAVSDANEAWIFEWIGRGKFGKGVVWVALRVPDGYVCGHANQARITTFTTQKSNKWDDPKQDCFHSADIITFAREHGYYDGPDAEFSFSDVYNPVNFGGARFCDARVWSVFRKINEEVRENPAYTDYALGNIRKGKRFPANRLPLWVKPDEKISLADMFSFMRDHYEDTPLDMRYDAGAGPFNLPYRWRPMEFMVDSVRYCHERAIATQQTGYSFVAQSRSSMPDPIGGIFWFGVDDADGTIYAPMYCGITEVPSSYRVGNGSMIEWSETSAFWTFNLVTNLAYTRYRLIHPEVEKYQEELEERMRLEAAKTDKEALEMYRVNPLEVKKLLTIFSTTTGDRLVSDWRHFFTYLFMKYVDGNIKQSQDRLLLENGYGKGVPKKPSHPGYGNEWDRRFMDNTGDHYKVKN